MLETINWAVIVRIYQGGDLIDEKSSSVSFSEVRDDAGDILDEEARNLFEHLCNYNGVNSSSFEYDIVRDEEKREYIIKWRR